MELNSELDRLQKYAEIDRELKRAEKKHPEWPNDMFRQLAIMQEEAGEVTKAILHYHYENGTLECVRNELIQTAAMCIRMLQNLHKQKNIHTVVYDFKVGDKVLFVYEDSAKTLWSTGFEYYIIEKIMRHSQREGGIAYRITRPDGFYVVNASGWQLKKYLK